MDVGKKDRLKNAGWTVGSVEEFLQLNPEESNLVELRLRLSEAIRNRRRSLGWSQEQLAKKLGSSQSRVAKLEAGTDRSSSIDLLFRALFVTELTAKNISNLFAAIHGLGSSRNPSS